MSHPVGESLEHPPDRKTKRRPFGKIGAMFQNGNGEYY